MHIGLCSVYTHIYGFVSLCKGIAKLLLLLLFIDIIIFETYNVCSMMITLYYNYKIKTSMNFSLIKWDLNVSLLMTTNFTSCTNWNS